MDRVATLGLVASGQWHWSKLPKMREMKKDCKRHAEHPYSCGCASVIGRAYDIYDRSISTFKFPGNLLLNSPTLPGESPGIPFANLLRKRILDG